MSLLLNFASGDILAIDGHLFRVNTPPPRLTGPDGRVIPLSNTDARLLSQVTIRISETTVPPGVALAITAPAGMTITRICEGDKL